VNKLVYVTLPYTVPMVQSIKQRGENAALHFHLFQHHSAKLIYNDTRRVIMSAKTAITQKQRVKQNTAGLSVPQVYTKQGQLTEYATATDK
jgi:hypothetical protein